MSSLLKSKSWVIVLIVVIASVLALSTFAYLNSPRIQQLSRAEVKGTIIDVRGKPPNILSSLINSTCELLRMKSSLHYNVRPVYRVLNPYVLINLTTFLRNTIGLDKFNHVATVSARGTNYSIFEIRSNSSVVGRLYYVSWKLVNNEEVKVLSYGEVKLKEIASKLSNVKPCGGVGYSPPEVLKYLKHLRGNFTVFKLTGVPKPLSSVYVVLIRYRVVIGNDSRIFMNSSIVTKFFIDYGNKVLKIEGPTIPPYNQKELSIEVTKYLSNLSTETGYAVVNVFLRGIMFSTHKVIKIPITFLVDPFLGIAYPEEGRYGIGYRVVQVTLQS